MFVLCNSLASQSDEVFLEFRIDCDCVKAFGFYGGKAVNSTVGGHMAEKMKPNEILFTRADRCWVGN